MRLRFALVLASFLLAAPLAYSATITVNGLGDALVADGVCTLREAILNANANLSTWVRATDGSSNTSTSCLTAVVPKSQSAADAAAVAAEAAAARTTCEASGLAPAGWFALGGGPVSGPKQ